MSKKVFTNEEVEMLNNNSYIYTVTPHILSFTKEFKGLFWKEYQAGDSLARSLKSTAIPQISLAKN